MRTIDETLSKILKVDVKMWVEFLSMFRGFIRNLSIEIVFIAFKNWYFIFENVQRSTIFNRIHSCTLANCDIPFAIRTMNDNSVYICSVVPFSFFAFTLCHNRNSNEENNSVVFESIEVKFAFTVRNSFFLRFGWEWMTCTCICTANIRFHFSMC